MINIKKKLIISLSIGLMIIPLIGCSSELYEDNSRFEKIDNINQSFAMYEVRDTETGVHYYVDHNYKLCPVYNFNGTIKSTMKTDNQ